MAWLCHHCHKTYGNNIVSLHITSPWGLLYIQGVSHPIMQGNTWTLVPAMSLSPLTSSVKDDLILIG